MSFGENIASLRKNANMSQDDLAHALSMTRPAYKQLETNQRPPSNSEMTAISELFGVRAETLLSSDVNAHTTPINATSSNLNRLKYKNLILYLAEKVGAKPNVGETVFYKLIYFVETLALHRSNFASTISNESFHKMQYGPVPSSFSQVTQEMINNNELDRVTGTYFTYMQTKYLPRVESVGLSDSEKRIIDDVILALGDKTATELSDLSHEDSPWVEAEMGEDLDLNLIKNTNDSYSALMARIPTNITTT